MNTNNKGKAVFLDRDGVINSLVYHQEQGIVDSPFTVEQFVLLPRVSEAIVRLHDMGYKVILVSNQPGIAKGHLTSKTFDEISEKMRTELLEAGASLNGEYYCLHHPQAEIAQLRIDCACRKPKPGLLLQAAGDMDIDLSQSWMIGDGLIDIQAGKEAGCRTILLGRMKCELCHLMDIKDARPDAITPDLKEAAQFIFETTVLKIGGVPS